MQPGLVRHLERAPVRWTFRHHAHARSSVWLSFNFHYSPNQPCASSSLTPMRRLPSMSSIHEPLTSASSLPPNGGTSFTVEPTATSTSMRSVAPPRLILVALAGD